MSDFKIRQTEIHLRRDKKSSMFVLTKIDSEGFSHTLFVSKRELVTKTVNVWRNS